MIWGSALAMIPPETWMILKKTVRETLFLIDLHNIDKEQPQHSWYKSGIKYNIWWFKDYIIYRRKRNVSRSAKRRFPGKYMHNKGKHNFICFDLLWGILWPVSTEIMFTGWSKGAWKAQIYWQINSICLYLLWSILWPFSCKYSLTLCKQVCYHFSIGIFRGVLWLILRKMDIQH